MPDTPSQPNSNLSLAFVFEVKLDGTQVTLYRQEFDHALTFEELVNWRQSVLDAHRCGVYQVDVVSEDSVREVFPGNPSYAKDQWKGWQENLPGKPAVPDLGGAYSNEQFAQTSDCKVEGTTPEQPVTPPTDNPPPVGTTEQPIPVVQNPTIPPPDLTPLPVVTTTTTTDPTPSQCVFDATVARGRDTVTGQFCSVSHEGPLPTTGASASDAYATGLGTSVLLLGIVLVALSKRFKRVAA